MKLRTCVLLAVLSIGVGGVLLSACASAPPTKVAAVADVGTKVEQSAGLLLDQAVKAQAANLISRAQLDVVALAVNKVGHLGVDLQSGLNDYRAIKAAGGDATKQAAAIQQTIADLQAALATVGKSIPNGTVSQIDQAVVNVLGLIAQIRAGVAL